MVIKRKMKILAFLIAAVLPAGPALAGERNDTPARITPAGLGQSVRAIPAIGTVQNPAASTPGRVVTEELVKVSTIAAETPQTQDIKTDPSDDNREARIEAPILEGYNRIGIYKSSTTEIKTQAAAHDPAFSGIHKKSGEKDKARKQDRMGFHKQSVTKEIGDFDPIPADKPEKENK
jgi:hypothetical protein